MGARWMSRSAAAIVRLRSRLTYANVVSTLCLFILLGGTAWAVANNSVGTAQLKNGAVTHEKLAANSVSSGNVIDGSLARSDLGGSLRTHVAGRCPVGYLGTLMNRLGKGGTLCIDHDARGPDTEYAALQDCAQSGFWLSTWGELWMADQAGYLNLGTTYWSDEFGGDLKDPRYTDAGLGLAQGGSRSHYLSLEAAPAFGPDKHYYACVGLPVH